MTEAAPDRDEAALQPTAADEASAGDAGDRKSEAVQPPLAEGVPSEAAASAGQLLRQAREAAGMHIAALAVAIKVPVRKLELLEADRLDALPDAVFARALAGSVCRVLRVDPAPILARLPDPSRPRLVPDGAGLNARFRGPASDGRTNRLADVPRPVRWVVLVLLVAALGIWLLPLAMPERDPGEATAVVDAAPRAQGPASPTSHGGAGSDAPIVTPPVSSLAVEQQKVAGVTGVVTPASDARSAAPEVAGQGAGLPAGAPSGAPAVAAAAAQPAPAVGASTMTAGSAVPAATAVRSTPTVISPTQVVTPSSGGIVVFSARGASWIEVTDVRGAVVLSRLLMPGETVGAGGATPLSVVVGRADATDVSVRGKPFDLAPVSRSNVARFEVK